jgi:acetyltransferase-like isoleucine patch superfamily enzyme
MSSGKYTYGNPLLYYGDSGASYRSGKFCSIAEDVTIYLGGNHRLDWVTTYPFGHVHTDTFNTFNGAGHPSTKGDVTIGNDVWISNKVTIMSGITIGDGAVIAHGSHVVKDIEQYSFVGGNPAKHIRYRFTPEQIKALLEIKWWDWEDDKINTYLPLLCGNIDAFINAVQ